MRDAVVAEYVSGDTCTEVAERHGISQQTVRRWVRQAGFQVRSTGYRKPPPWLPEAIKRYEAGETITSIAQRLGYADSNVHYHLKNAGVKFRARGPVVPRPPKGWRPPTVDEVAGHEPAVGWQEQAVCRGETHIMFPGRGQAESPARALCAVCPVILDCAVVGVRDGEKFGIWGGLSEKQRRAYRRDVGRWKDCIECGSRFVTRQWSRSICSVECGRARHARQAGESRRAS